MSHLPSWVVHSPSLGILLQDFPSSFSPAQPGPKAPASLGAPQGFAPVGPAEAHFLNEQDGKGTEPNQKGNEHAHELSQNLHQPDQEGNDHAAQEQTIEKEAQCQADKDIAPQGTPVG